MTCEKCKLLKSPSSFPKGVRVGLKNLGNCKKCEVTLSEPLTSNKNIITLYEMLPSWDSWSGFKTFNIQDVIALFELMNIDKDLWDDYYQKLIFFHNEFVTAKVELDKAIEEKQNKIGAENNPVIPNSKRSGNKQ